MGTWTKVLPTLFEQLRPIYVPNSIFTGIVVENATRMRNRRMIENFSLRYEDIGKISRILSRIDDLVQQIPEVDSREPHYAVFIRGSFRIPDC
ncbi:hypothetical protein [Endozoicomonas atrinae]|uniref:hypothetical protein n=1 Tax=Endozoicomonas atrinae TaxID=1333660 RepID=UPI003AFFA7BE